MRRAYPNRTAKLALAHEMLAAGSSTYAVNKECKRRFGSALGYTDLLKVKVHLTAVQPQPQPQPQPPGAIIPVVLPAELTETLPVPAPNGTGVHFNGIQDWMKRVQAEQVILTKEGKVSVLAWHQFDLGGSDRE